MVLHSIKTARKLIRHFMFNTISAFPRAWKIIKTLKNNDILSLEIKK